MPGLVLLYIHTYKRTRVKLIHTHTHTRTAATAAARECWNQTISLPNLALLRTDTHTHRYTQTDAPHTKLTCCKWCKLSTVQTLLLFVVRARECTSRKSKRTPHKNTLSRSGEMQLKSAQEFIKLYVNPFKIQPLHCTPLCSSFFVFVTICCGVSVLLYTVPSCVRASPFFSHLHVVILCGDG